MTSLVGDDTGEWGGGGRTRYLAFDGENWVKYDLSRLPETYRRPSTREGIELTFDVNGPDGLIWFTGTYHNNIQLALRVRSRLP